MIERHIETRKCQYDILMCILDCHFIIIISIIIIIIVAVIKIDMYINDLMRAIINK